MITVLACLLYLLRYPYAFAILTAVLLLTYKECSCEKQCLVSTILNSRSI